MYSIGAIFGLCSLLLLFYCVHSSDNEWYILIEDANMFRCGGGIRQRVTVEKEDVVIRDEHGKEARYIKGPGEYAIHFRRIRVDDSLGYLSGELSATVQIPLFESRTSIRLDLPVSVIPEMKLLRAVCDEQSGLFNEGFRPYCRYCDLCLTLDDVEKELSRNHKYLPNLERGAERGFSRICTQIDRDTYELFRTVRLPDRQEMERRINQNSGSLSEELKQKLSKGKGRLQVHMRLKHTHQRPESMKDYLLRNCNCRRGGLWSFVNPCDMEECKSRYVRQCLPASAETVACYIAEFSYRLTTDRRDLDEFIRKHGFKSREEAVVEPESEERTGTSNKPRDISQDCIDHISSPTRRLTCRNWRNSSKKTYLIIVCCTWCRRC